MAIRSAITPSLTRTNKEQITQSSHGFTAGDALKRSSGSFAKAQADTDANARVVGIVESVIDANTFVVVYEGRISVNSDLWSDANVYFLSATTAGALTTTAPTIAKQCLIATGARLGLVILGDGGSSASAEGAGYYMFGL